MKVPILLFISLGCWLWLWLMFKRPDKWAVWVDKESDFWVNKGIASASLTERIKCFEKGLGQKVLVGIAAVTFTLAAIVYIVLKILY